MPKFVPMPISPRRLAPSSVASAALQVVLAAARRARVHDLAVAERQLDAVDVDARPASCGRVKRTVPVGARLDAGR